MTRIDFAFGASDRLRAACQAARKRYQAGQQLVVYCADGARLAAFDRMLWAFDDISFVPHVLASDPLAADTPVILTAAAPQPATAGGERSEEHTSELQSLMRISYAVFCLKKKNNIL